MLRKKIVHLMQGIHLGEKFKVSDQQKGLPLPSPEKKVGRLKIVKLPDPLQTATIKPEIKDCIHDRKSTRRFADRAITMQELSFLLWATQGIRRMRENLDQQISHHAIKRTVPSGGSRHPFETYIVVQNVKGLSPGVYRYVATLNSLVVVSKRAVSQKRILEACCGQVFCAKAPILFIWAALPYRTEWRYGIERAMKSVLLDAGHVGQNLHLSCETLRLGTCMIAAYIQELVDKIIKVNGK